MATIKNVEQALQNFEIYSNKQAEYSELGNYKSANVAYKNILSSVYYLKEQGQINLLEKFLDFSSIGVRLWAAYFLLPQIESKSIKVLKEISLSPTIHGFTAETTIEEWNNGTLEFP
ncbi:MULTISPECIES: DUF2019 domain-containing protein [unclassified Empedobacter]|uniref:DUF2019 domain-containing protein n=1 Tax=unclassified Empedobacter TaxID=2643773 RepID=UPI0025C0BC17|nr:MULTISPECIES: DUF2019 domain-containing protein [unclassified Empedobacter]